MRNQEHPIYLEPHGVIEEFYSTSCTSADEFRDRYRAFDELAGNCFLTDPQLNSRANNETSRVTPVYPTMAVVTKTCELIQEILEVSLNLSAMQGGETVLDNGGLKHRVLMPGGFQGSGSDHVYAGLPSKNIVCTEWELDYVPLLTQILKPDWEKTVRKGKLAKKCEDEIHEAHKSNLPILRNDEHRQRISINQFLAMLRTDDEIDQRTLPRDELGHSTQDIQRLLARALCDRTTFTKLDRDFLFKPTDCNSINNFDAYRMNIEEARIFAQRCVMYLAIDYSRDYERASTGEGLVKYALAFHRKQASSLLTTLRSKVIDMVDGYRQQLIESHIFHEAAFTVIKANGQWLHTMLRHLRMREI